MKQRLLTHCVTHAVAIGVLHGPPGVVGRSGPWERSRKDVSMLRLSIQGGLDLLYVPDVTAVSSKVSLVYGLGYSLGVADGA